jgi:hypothetical protein
VTHGDGPTIRTKKLALHPIVALALVIAPVLPACSDAATGPGAEGIAMFAGTWRCTQFSITHNKQAGTVFDLVGSGGAVQMSIQSSGTFSGTATVPGPLLGHAAMGPVTVPLSGILRMVGEGIVRIDFIPDIPPVFTTMETEYTMIGHTLALKNEESVFDFDGDGVGEPGRFSWIFTRE